jgi:hypothetical protein
MQFLRTMFQRLRPSDSNCRTTGRNNTAIAKDIPKSVGSLDTGSIKSTLSGEKDVPFDACRVLSAANIPCYTWGEHALSYGFGIPTVVWDVFLLVDDPEAATQVLLDWGVVRAKPNPRFARISQFRQAPRFVVSTSSPDNSGKNAGHSKGNELSNLFDEEDPGWVLLRASDWPNNTLASAGSSYIPSMPAYLNCLISTYMETFDLELRSHICCHIAYFYYYLKEVKTDEFSKKILLENRQFQFDRLAPNKDRREIMAERILLVHRDIRQRIRRGEQKPCKNAKLTSIN